jgi:DNA-binding NtrC family response regulator
VTPSSTQVLYCGATGHAPILHDAAALAGLSFNAVLTAADLVAHMQTGEYAVAVVEFGIPDLDPGEFMECARKLPNPAMPIFLTGNGTSTTEAIQLVKMGAYQCADAGMGAQEWSQLLYGAAEEAHSRELSGDPAAGNWRSLLVGASPCMKDLARLIELVAKRRCTVLITGETGTGKEMAARAIHMASSRGHLPMVALNCSAIPEHLLEAELFGHTKGAFTGAVGPRAGRFEEANNSTLFLDEIGDMPIDLQAKLLRVLQERELTRLGSSETIKVNARVIAASNHDLFDRVRQGKFREDLYYRLNVVPIQVPPLRQRAPDIRLLARHFVAKICELEGIAPKEVYNETLEHLTRYAWPGNVRQLENIVEKAVVMSGRRGVLLPGDFELPAEAPRVDVAKSVLQFSVPVGGIDFSQVVTSFERSLLVQALQMTNGNRTLAADLLRLKRTTLVSKLRALQLP